MDKLHALEKRMKLLKESFEAGVIDAEEYTQNKGKLEKEIEDAKVMSKISEASAEELAYKKKPAKKHAEQPQEPQEVEKHKQAEPPTTQEKSAVGKEEVTLAQKEPKIVEQEEQQDTESEKQKPEISSEAEMQPEEKENHKEPEQTPKERKDVEILIEEAESGPKPTSEEPPVSPQAPKVEKDKKDEKSTTLSTALWVIGAIALLGLLAYFSISPEKMSLNGIADTTEDQNPLIACRQHMDCAMPGMEAKCLNPGTVDAVCQYQNATPVGLIVIGTEECAACSTERMKNILLSWFPGATITEVASSSAEGKALRAQHSIMMLPAYVLSADVEQTLLFEDVNSALRESKNAYVVKDSASGAALYLNRETIAGRVDVFLAGDDSSDRAILNMEEFVAAFDNALFEFHIVKDSNDSKTAACVAELAPQRTLEFLICQAKEHEDCVDALGLGASAIASCVEQDGQRFIADAAELQKLLGVQTPAFLINNRMKLGGVQAADTLREMYCSMNDAAACSKELRKSLV
jgi:hypothetical protein